MTELPAAVLWDMDGTLIDTEPYWMDAEIALIESYGGTWDHVQALALVGQGLGFSARVMQSRGVDMPEQAIIEHLTGSVLDQVRSGGLPWRPGARELLVALREAGVATALVTMSIHSMAAFIADSVGFVAFDHVVAGDDVPHPKPHPAAYLRAAELLGVRPVDCVAIEDSAPGVGAAVAAGVATIGVPLNVPLPESGGFVTWPTLVGRTVADLADVLAASRAQSPA